MEHSFCETGKMWINDRCIRIIEMQEGTLKELEVVVGVHTDSCTTLRVSGEQDDPRLVKLQQKLDRIEDLTASILKCAERIRETIG